MLFRTLIRWVILASSSLVPLVAYCAYGDQVGSFNSVIAYSNGNTLNNSGDYNVASGYTTGLKWQCVEYCRRYYWSTYGLQIGAGVNASGFYGNGWGLAKASNGGTVAPVPGAILCSASATYGHVAIVREVGPDYIKVIHQNWNNNSDDNAHRFSMTVSNGTYRVNSAGSYSWQGWLMPPVVANPATISWVSLPQSDRWYRSDEHLVYHAGGDDPVTTGELVDGTQTNSYPNNHDGYLALSYYAPGWHYYEATAHNNVNGGTTVYTGRWYGGWDPNPPTATQTGGASPNTWYHSTTSVSFTCTDPLSGVRRCHYKWDNNPFSDWARVDNGTVALLPGKHHLYVEAEDNTFSGTSESGNTAVIDLGEYWLDTNAAAITPTAQIVSSGNSIQIKLTLSNPNQSPVNGVSFDLVQLGATKASGATWTPGDIQGQSSAQNTFTFPIGFGSQKTLVLTANYRIGTETHRLRIRIAKP